MAKLFIAEFSKNAHMWAGGETISAPQADDNPAYVEQTIAIGGASVPSAAFGGATRMIRVHTDAICSIQIAAAPVATSDTMRLAAGQTEYFGVKPGHKIAVIVNT